MTHIKRIIRRIKYKINTLFRKEVKPKDFIYD